MTRSCFITIDYRRCSFRHLDALHPCAWYIFHTEVLRQTTHSRCVFCQQLHVCTRQSEQFNCLCSCCSICVCHIHRSICFKRFRQVTACCFTQLCASDFCSLQCAHSVRNRTCSACRNSYLLQLFGVFAHHYDQWHLCFCNVHCICFIRQIVEHQMMAVHCHRNCKVTINVRHSTDRSIQPKHLCANHRFAFIVNHLT